MSDISFPNLSLVDTLKLELKQRDSSMPEVVADYLSEYYASDHVNPVDIDRFSKDDIKTIYDYLKNHLNIISLGRGYHPQLRTAFEELIKKEMELDGTMDALLAHFKNEFDEKSPFEFDEKNLFWITGGGNNIPPAPPKQKDIHSLTDD